MDEKKKVLIITDGSEGVSGIAAEITAALNGDACGACTVSVKTAAEFKGNDILPAEAFYLGCEKPEPESFSYLADLLKHINLAGRPCGVFSAGAKKTAAYLAALVKDCEAALNPTAFLPGQETELTSWAQNTVSRSF
jgi:hypothetical protein